MKEARGGVMCQLMPVRARRRPSLISRQVCCWPRSHPDPCHVPLLVSLAGVPPPTTRTISTELSAATQSMIIDDRLLTLLMYENDMPLKVTAARSDKRSDVVASLRRYGSKVRLRLAPLHIKRTISLHRRRREQHGDMEASPIYGRMAACGGKRLQRAGLFWVLPVQMVYPCGSTA
ncbi:hypothetical protein DFH94DRAFT_220505 [Russula ochroleuca]|jgi:hypothetical protein|uniref:Uncharacterized protein n=1 Tax=Russula ochroleuca TaxID=152965 RepID=A0A9P5JYX5_9AGAM|nr:hypothetical protein DFH94DRAFT_220505 [Russula ochroleuca]